MIHYTHSALLGREGAQIIVAGAGGNGSQLLPKLARLHHSLVMLGGKGFDVTVYDPDEVSEANVARQMFALADIGRNKAITMVNRVNAFFGLDWVAVPRALGEKRSWSNAHMLILCVDSRAARANIAKAVEGTIYTMDLGNRASDGQVVLGQRGRHNHGQWRDDDDDDAGDEIAEAAVKAPENKVDLPDPYKLFPELVDTRQPEDNTPSCSLAEALAKQELFINDDVTTAAAEILWELFRKGCLTWHGAFVNAATGRRSPIAVDPELWKRMSPTAPPTPRRKRK